MSRVLEADQMSFEQNPHSFTHPAWIPFRAVIQLCRLESFHLGALLVHHWRSRQYALNFNEEKMKCHCNVAGVSCQGRKVGCRVHVGRDCDDGRRRRRRWGRLVSIWGECSFNFTPHIGGYCRKIGFPGRLILSKGKGLWEIWFSWKYPTRIDFPGSLILYSGLQSRVCLTKKARNPPFGSMQFSRLCEASLEVYDRVTGCNCYKCRASDLRGW